MGVLDALSRLEIDRRQGARDGAATFGTMMNKQNAIALSKEFASRGDFTADGISKFMGEKSLDPQSMELLLNTVLNVSKLRQAEQPQFGYGANVGVYQQTGKGAGQVVAPVPEDLPGNIEEAVTRQAVGQGTDIPGLVKLKGQLNPQSPSNIFKMIGERDSLPQGDPRRTEIGKVIAKAGAQNGVKMSVDKDGNITLLTNADQSELTPATKNKVQEESLKTSDSLRRIKGIIESFDPAFLSKPYRAKQAYNNFAEGWGFKELNENEELSLAEYTEFGRKSIENINLYIKQITGAQMSEAEASRLRLAIPDFGDAWWRGDGPTKFKAKMLDVYEQLILSQARYNYVRKNGLTIARDENNNAMAFLDGNGRALSLDGMKAIIDQRGEELEGAGMDEAEVLRELSKELGVTF